MEQVCDSLGRVQGGDGVVAVGNLESFYFLKILVFGLLQHLDGNIRVQAAGHIGSLKLKDFLVCIADPLNKINRFSGFNAQDGGNVGRGILQHKGWKLCADRNALFRHYLRKALNRTGI